MRTRAGIATLVAGLVAAALAAPPAHAAAPPSAGTAADRYTPVVMDVMTAPRWYKDRKGALRLVYELRLTNAFPVPVEVTGVQVRDARRHRTVQSLAGQDLASSMTPMASPGDPDTTVVPSGDSVVWMDVPFKRRAAIPAAVKHTLTVDVPPGLPVPATIVSSAGFSKVDRRPPTVLHPPLRGTGWVAVGSCCDGPHRRSIQPVNGGLFLGQRFAIDWNGMDRQGRFVVGDPSLNESWTFYGKPVLAVADGVVVQAVDRWPDQVPNAPRPVGLEEADGNYVILKLGPRRFAFYAHLKPGSVAVKRGDRVKAGQAVGRLGNTGSSTGPHLHFQLMDRGSALASDGLPYVFDRYRYVGEIPPLDDALFALAESGSPVPLATAGAGPRSASLPVGRDTVNFRD